MFSVLIEAILISGAVINPELLKPPISRTNFQGPKAVLAIEV